MADRPIVIVTRKLPDVVETRLRELFDARLNLDDKPFSREELIEAAKTANVLVPTVTDRIDRGVLSQAGPDLKLIAQFGTGVDNIDLETARNRSIIVTNTPGVLTEDTADMTMALILSVPRRLAEGAAVLSEDKPWNGWSPTWMLGHRIWGKRLGIIGMGRIGQAVARRARAFGLQIHYHNRRRLPAKIEEELTATYWESLDQMLARMDIISVNCPHTPATYHLLSARRLKLIRPDAYIVNTARGEVVERARGEQVAEPHALRGGVDAEHVELALVRTGLDLEPDEREQPAVALRQQQVVRAEPGLGLARRQVGDGQPPLLGVVREGAAVDRQPGVLVRAGHELAHDDVARGRGHRGQVVGVEGSRQEQQLAPRWPAGGSWLWSRAARNTGRPPGPGTTKPAPVRWCGLL